MSIELSLEDVKKIAFHFGFVMEVNTNFLVYVSVTLQKFSYSCALMTLFDDHRRKK